MQTVTSLCPQCGKAQMTSRPGNGLEFCVNCGTVPSFKNRDSDVGEKSPGQKIAPKEIDGHYRSGLRDENNILFHKWTQSARLHDQTDKNFALALWAMTKGGFDLSLSKEVIQSSAELLKAIFLQHLTKGRPTQEFCATTLYLACRKHGLAMTLDEVARTMKCDKQKIAYTLRLVAKELGLTLPAFDLSQYCRRLLSDLEVTGRTSKVIDELLKIVNTPRIASGRDPRGLASAIVYIALRLSGEKTSQRRISDLTGITETTIRSRCREIEGLVEQNKGELVYGKLPSVL